MTPPRAPRPLRRAPDLGPTEADVGAWFAGCARGAPPAGVLGGGSPARATPGLGGRPHAAWLRGAATAALALVALAVGRSGPTEARTADARPHGPGAAPSVFVIDDPSVPMFHAVETFDEVGLLARATDAGGGLR